MKTLLTDHLVDELELPAGKNDAWIWDRQQAGLGLRLRRGKDGISRTWYCGCQIAGQDRPDPLGRNEGEEAR
jgi:hypothetical protein